MKSERIDISDDMTDEFYKDARFGQILRFEGGDFKIVRLNRKSKICMVVPAKTYDVDEFNEELERRDKENDKN